MSESVDWNFIENNRELINAMLGDLLGYVATKCELATAMNKELKIYLIDRSIIYASAVASGGFGVSNFEECFASEEINIIPSFVIPTEFRKKLENEIDEVIQEDLENKNEELFIIKPGEHLGRKVYLYKSVIYQIKLKHKEYMGEQDIKLFIDYSYDDSFKDIVEDSYDDIVNRSIHYLLCYESKRQEYEDCIKILVQKTWNSKPFYRLERHRDIELKKQIDNFLNNFLNKKFDVDIFNANKKIEALLKIINKSKKIDEELKETLVKTVIESEEIDDEFKKSLVKTISEAEYAVIGAKVSLVNKIKGLNKDEFQEALVNTIIEAEKAIDEIFHFEAYDDCQKCRQIRQEYADLFKNSIERVTNPEKLKNFKVALEKAKLNYVSKYKDRYIYPFIYDLIVISFSFSIKSELYKMHIEKPRILVKSIGEMKKIDIDSDKSYLFEDLLRLIDALPDEFKNVNPALLIIKHYSEILAVDYMSIVNVLKQLRVKEAGKGTSLYYFSQSLKNIRLSFDNEHFRALSLEVL